MKIIQCNLIQTIACFLAFAMFIGTSTTMAGDTKVDVDNKHLIHFGITQAAQVDNDIAEIRFHHIAQAATAEQVMQEINQHMQSAIDIIKKHQPDDGSKLQIQTSQYQVYPAYNKQQLITHWKGQQSLIITAKNWAGLPKILTEIQPVLSYQSTDFRISETKKQQWISKLTAEALQRYQHQAQKIAQSFGTQHYRLVETQIQTPFYNQPPRQPYLQATARMAEQSVPVIESGRGELRIQVNGTLQIDNP